MSCYTSITDSAFIRAIEYFHPQYKKAPTLFLKHDHDPLGYAAFEIKYMYE